METQELTFKERLKGRFSGVMRWHNLDDLWARVKADADGGWFIYAVGEPVPGSTASAAQVEQFVDELDSLLRRDHDHDYCGIVYADDLQTPSLIKVYDPNNLGASCGSSGLDIQPGWVIGKYAPEDIQTVAPLPGNRKRWWRGLFGGKAAST